MKPRPEMYQDVLIFGSGQDGPGVARLGGWLKQPNLGLSYLLAARHVIESGAREAKLNEVALPAAYLQRHALEVAIKHLTDTAYMLKRDEEWVAERMKNPKAWGRDAKTSKFKHRLDDVLTELVDALAAIKYEVPPDVCAMVGRLSGVEADEPTRLRYSTIKGGTVSFADETILRVDETQDLLEELFERVFRYREEQDTERQTLATSLGYEGMALDQTLHSLGIHDDEIEGDPRYG